MSVKRVYTVKHARQRYAKSYDGEVKVVPVMRKDGTPKLGRGGKPMMRRIRPANKAQPLPNYKCGKCGDEIKVGDPYIYWEPYFRSSAKSVRCTKSSCYPRPSERESSAMATILAAQEAAQDTIAQWDRENISDLEAARDDVVQAYEEVIEQYREADESFGGQGATEAAQRAEDLESEKDEWESLDFDEFDESEVEECDHEEEDPDEEDAEVEEHDNDTCEEYQERLLNAREEWADEQVAKFEEMPG